MWSRGCSCFGGLVPEGNPPGGDDRGPDRKGKVISLPSNDNAMILGSSSLLGSRGSKVLLFSSHCSLCLYHLTNCYAASNEMGRQAAEILFDPDTDYDEVHSILGDGETIPYHRQLAALSDALGVAVRVVFLDTRLDRLGRPSPFHRDFSPTTHHWKIPRWSRKTFPPDSISLDEVRYTTNAARCVATSSSSGHRRAFVTLLYRPGGAAEADHYDILYPKLNVIPGSSLGHADVR
ncbi:hypothetical protein OPV22_019403 [Ensete ventricosum]|uniref:Ubiquitinyl hydrolase 1 n=1 Tax=Ensete ventricosum TaxID=4639 RepID=A0AAV8QBB9_ENSVE|nr:hypothetical protein OPV22_019403 [Ensete ventricosum]